MEVRSTYKYRGFRLQGREVTREIRVCLFRQRSIARFTPKKAAFLIGKTLRAQSPTLRTTPNPNLTVW